MLYNTGSFRVINQAPDIYRKLEMGERVDLVPWDPYPDRDRGQHSAMLGRPDAA